MIELASGSVGACDKRVSDVALVSVCSTVMWTRNYRLSL